MERELLEQNLAWLRERVMFHIYTSLGVGWGFLGILGTPRQKETKPGRNRGTE